MKTSTQSTKRLVSTLVLSGIAFFSSGLLIQQFTGQTLTVLIDRSYCPSAKWQPLADEYTRLYQRHQRQQTTLQTVVLFSDLSQMVLDNPPAPETIRTLETYGQSSAAKQSALQRAYPDATLLSCQSSL